MPALKDLEHVTAADRAEWRAWLEANHAASPGVWLVLFKKGSGTPGVSYDEAVDECLCFGWIDSKVNSIDERRYKQLITPRKPGSGWSKINKAKVERLIAEGRMTAAGLAKIDAAKGDGSWTALDAVESLAVPDDLRAALDADEQATKYFAAFSASTRKHILAWIASAKRPETRLKRVARTVELAARNEKAQP
jgi:uncharacterized protein YdeI (YjbR/CyaY-like superfamily)